MPTPKPVRKMKKAGQALSRKVNRDLMNEGISRMSPDKTANIQAAKHTHKLNSGKEVTKKEIREMKKRH